MTDSALRASYSRLGVNDAYDGRERREILGDKAMLAASRSDQELSVDLRLAQTLSPLKSVTESHLAELIRNSSVELVFRGQPLFEAGSYDRQHIYLLHGDLELVDSHGSRTIVSGSDTLKALAHEQPRPCRAVALTDCGVLRVDSEYLDKMLTWSQVAEYMLLDIAYQRDLDEDAEWMMTILKSNLFHKVPPINAQIIFDRLNTLVVEAGEAVLRQGEIGDNCYFIKTGEAEVRQSPDGMTPPVPIAEIGPGRCFGEDALVNETVRNASVIMKTDGVLMYISKRDFLKLLKEPRVQLADAHEVRALLDEGAISIDVRTEEEYEAEHLDRAINLPLNLLRIKTRLLSKDVQYVIYCDTGRRSRAAAHLLTRAGYKAVALDAGLKGLRPAQGVNLSLDNASFLLKDGMVVRES
ncbi:cyclic nucleotide-binding domain-containing protein [Gilvimarinus sp. F26214L]|uniref:cyclic nucleotide-binding domain-containing protein n=1 Tax=Gilvimarinus sp. DZF01 TaxID=3461371 RepID=UPI00404522B3